MAMSGGQSSSSGSTDSPINIDTPEGSYTEAPDLTDSQCQTLRDCELYAESISNICKDLRKYGYTEKSIPAFPKSELLELMGVKKQPKVLIGYELHNYLQNKICSDTNITDIPTPETYGISEATTLNEMRTFLQDGYKVLQKQQAKSIGLSLKYGKWLNNAYELFEYNKGAGNVKGSWSKWLKENIGITDRYARQLRELARALGEYEKIHLLCITITEIWQRRLNIRHMLFTEPEIDKFWRKV